MISMRPQSLKWLFVVLGIVPLLMACPDQRAQIQAEITSAQVALHSRAKTYAHICYRDEASLEEGSTLSERQQYYIELMKEISTQAQTDYSEQDLERLKKDFLSWKQRLSTQKILQCAERNFKFISKMDEAWFRIFDHYGIEAQAFEQGIYPMLNNLLASNVIAVGNNHSL